MVIPFWWVSATDDPKAENIIEKRFVDKSNGVSFVVLVNSRQVKAMEKLCMYKQNTAADGGATSAASEPKRLRST
jgi:ribosomal silencing factor RsfS